MTRFLVRLATLVLRRWDAPVESHPVPHLRCIRCSDYARGFYKAAALAQQSDEERAWREFLAAYEKEAA